MKILLTDAEIEAIPATNFGGNVDDLNIAQAQLKKVVEWVEENSHTDYGAPSEGDYWCFSKKLWEALLKEVE